MAIEEVVDQRVRCRTCGVELQISLLKSPATFEYDIALWQQRCPERERASPLRCPSFAHQLEAGLLEHQVAE
jgi:hypothetical protein